VARTFSAEEIAAEAGVPQDRVAWLVSIGIVKPSQSGALRFGDVFRVKLVSALLGAGLTEAILERATAEGWLNLDHVDAYLPNEPSPRSSHTFADFVTSAGPTASTLPSVYEVLGAATARSIGADPRRRGGDVRAVLRWVAPRERGRRPAPGGATARRGHEGSGDRWTELLDEQMGRPAQERMFRREIDRFPREVTLAVATLVRLAPEMFVWLSYRYIEQRFVAGIVEGVERFLATHELLPMPQSQGPPAIVFVDLSGFTRLTEERGDEAAVRSATTLQRHADAVATRRGGRLVKLLGDGALLQFSEVGDGVEAAVDLVETMEAAGSLSAHAGIHTGPVIERDLDLFGGTVNLASRIASVAGRGEVLASRAVVEAADDASLRFERVDERSFKGISEPVTLFRASRDGR
jgi:class 3 adenylate cyclase